jgi:type IX secretion system PorP/SprF family membrane protein
MSKYKSLLLLALCIGAVGANAQQDPMHAQNFLNTLRINPAYAGYKETAVISIFHRSQWVGFKGAPSTQTITFDMPTKRGKVAFGGTISHDKIGPTSELTLMGDATYRAQVTRAGFISFGLKATGSLFQANMTDLDLVSDHYGQQDEFFLTNSRSVFMPNVGFGFFFHDQKRFVSVSVPRILRNDLDSKTSETYSFSNGFKEPILYASAGQIWKINRNYKFQPTIQTKAVMNAPLSIGANANLFIFDAFKVGAFYYWKEVAGAFIQVELDKKWKFGYSMDFAASRLAFTNFGSHEVMASYTLKAKRRRIVYPRYF